MKEQAAMVNNLCVKIDMDISGYPGGIIERQGIAQFGNSKPYWTFTCDRQRLRLQKSGLLHPPDSRACFFNVVAPM